MSLVYNTTKNTAIELINVGDGLMYIDPTTQEKNILVKLTDTAYYNISTGKTETLVELSKSGGGVEFKTYCYALNNGCCLIDLNNDNLLAGIYVKGVLTTNYPSTTGWKVMCGGRSRSTQYISSFLSFQDLSTKSTAVMTGNAGGFTTETLIDSSGNIIKTNFENSKKGMSTTTGSKIGIFAQYRNDDNTFNYYVNDFAKIQNIILYDISNNEIVNLVPAIVNGESGMYDTVTETFYGNANSVGSLVCE